MKRFFAVVVGLAALTSTPVFAQPANCAALSGDVASTAIALPTTGAKYKAGWIAATATAGAYCKVLGNIAPVDPAAPPVLFQVNLPASWNGKAVQYGGGGMNGTLISGLGTLRNAPPGPTPLEQGYATFGTDGGHPEAKPEIQIFALNAEALSNHGYGAYKKTHDVAARIMADYYGRKPKRLYFFGGSEGGREAMIAVQRFPADYDGAVAYVPVLNYTAMSLAKYALWQGQFNGGWIGPEQMAVIEQATLTACDSRDGLKDGVISDYLGCAAAFDPASLGCGRPSAPAKCLTDRQVAQMRALRKSFPLPYALANGVTRYAGFPYGDENGARALYPSVWDARQPSPGDLGSDHLPNGTVRYFITRNPAFTGPLDLNAYKTRIREVSAIMDATDTNLAPLAARGGKLIMVEEAADYVQSPQTGYDYYDAVRKRLGPTKVDAFMRLYATPGTGHYGQGEMADGLPPPTKIDLLAVLDRWADQSQAPPALTQVRYSTDAPTRPLASRPLCAYPTFPAYQGGDPAQASSFSCKR